MTKNHAIVFSVGILSIAGVITMAMITHSSDVIYIIGMIVMLMVLSLL